MSLNMNSFKVALLLCVVSAASSLTIQKARSSAKRDTYNYPQPDTSFSADGDEAANSDNGKSGVIVETISSQGRYFSAAPASSLSSEDGEHPLNVSFEAFEQHDNQEGEIFPEAPSSTAAPVVTPTKSKKPKGGLGAFKYYGGKGKSKPTERTSNSVTATTFTTSAPQPTFNVRKQPVSFTVPEVSPSTYKPPVKNIAYDYPSPKNVLKPSKKEQKLADSRGEESSQGYDYDVGPGSYQTGINSYSSGAQQSSPSLFSLQSPHPQPAAGNAMGMGLSYMRQSSPFFSYHVMLD